MHHKLNIQASTPTILPNPTSRPFLQYSQNLTLQKQEDPMHSAQPVAEELRTLTYGFSCLSSKACVGGAPILQTMQHSSFCVSSSEGPGASALCRLHHRMITAGCSAWGCAFSLVGLNVTRTCFHANVSGRTTCTMRATWSWDRMLSWHALSDVEPC